jgi:hypothetical protein
MVLDNDTSMRRVKSLIKNWMLQLEEVPEWKTIPPHIINGVRKAITRTAWGAYKIGIVSDKPPTIE